MDLLGIALIIITVVGSVHIVYEKGKQAGISHGRQEILLENLKRTQLDKQKFDVELKNVMAKINCA